MLFPIKMKENRVWRLYYGGKLIDRLCGSGSGEDANFPENWLASVVVADNPDRPGKPADEGLSKVDGGEHDGMSLRELILSDPERYLGRAHVAAFGANFGVLTKFLDSAERLPIQVHPTKQAAKELFHSDYGKTESWYILDGRRIDGEEPYILLGFKKPVSKAIWKELFEKQDIDGMQEYMHKIPVKKGDVYLIAGGTPHAIGSGCLLLEVQEPTDYTISVEKCDLRGNLMPDHLCHMGLGFDKMFDCFTYEAMSLDKLKSRYALRPAVTEQQEGGTAETLITYADTPCFGLDRVRVTGEMTRKSTGRACCLAVVSGCGVIEAADGRSVAVKSGDCLFKPAECAELTIRSTGEDMLEILECLPPEIK